MVVGLWRGRPRGAVRRLLGFSVPHDWPGLQPWGVRSAQTALPLPHHHRGTPPALLPRLGAASPVGIQKMLWWRETAVALPDAASSTPPEEGSHPQAPQLLQYGPPHPQAWKSSWGEGAEEAGVLISRRLLSAGFREGRSSSNTAKKKLSKCAADVLQALGRATQEAGVHALLDQRGAQAQAQGGVTRADLKGVLAHLQQHQEWRRAYWVFKWMQKQAAASDRRPQQWDYGTLLLILADAGRCHEAWAAYGAMLREGYAVSVYHITSLIKAFCANRMFERAEECLAMLKPGGRRRLRPNGMAYATLVRGYADAGQLVRMEDALARMQSARLEPDPKAFASVLATLGKVRSLAAMERFFESFGAAGVEASMEAFCTMAHAYGVAGQYEHMKRMYARMLQAGHKHNHVSYYTAVDLFGRAGLFREMEQALNDMVSSDKGASTRWVWQSALTAYLSQRKYAEAASMVRRMREVGCEPDVGTTTLVLSFLADKAPTDGDRLSCLQVLQQLDAQGSGVVEDMMYAPDDAAEDIWRQAQEWLLGVQGACGLMSRLRPLYIWLIEALGSVGQHRRALAVLHEALAKGIPLAEMRSAGGGGGGSSSKQVLILQQLRKHSAQLALLNWLLQMHTAVRQGRKPPLAVQIEGLSERAGQSSVEAKLESVQFPFRVSEQNGRRCLLAEGPALAEWLLQQELPQLLSGMLTT
eukprot:jgi/Mesen1/4920/ME000246S04144